MVPHSGHASRSGSANRPTDSIRSGLGYLDETKVRLAEVVDAGGRVEHEYDFGDGWEHKLAVEARTEARVGPLVLTCRFAR